MFLMSEVPLYSVWPDAGIVLIILSHRERTLSPCEYLGANGTSGCKGMSGTKLIHSLKPHMYIHLGQS